MLKTYFFGEGVNEYKGDCCQCGFVNSIKTFVFRRSFGSSVDQDDANKLTELIYVMIVEWLHALNSDRNVYF